MAKTRDYPTSTHRLLRRWRPPRHAVPEPAARRTGRRTAVAMALLAIVAGAVPVAVRAGTPGSDPANGSWVGGLVLMPGPDQLVLWNLPGTTGAHGTCIEAAQDGPLRGPYTAQRMIDDPVYGELNHLYANAGTSDVRLAELSALNSHKYDLVNTWTQWSYVVNGQGGMSVGDAGAMLQRATDLAGPYRVSVALPAGVRAGPTYAATISVTSASRVPVPGARVTIAASGARATSSSVTTNASGLATVRFTVAAGTSTSYTLQASVQSWTGLVVFGAPGEQHMLSAASPTTQRGSATGTITRDRQLALVKVAADDPAHQPVAGYVYRISDATGHVVIASVTTGTAPVSLGRLRMGARYTATEIARPAGATLYIPLQADTSFTVPDGDGTWQLTATDPRMPTPALATHVSAERVLVGATLSDQVTVSGDDGEDGTIEAVRYGPVAPPASGSCADVSLSAYRAARAVRVTGQVRGASGSGNGTVTITGPRVTVAGCYGWAESLTLRPSGATATSAPIAPHESTLVTAPAPAARTTTRLLTSPAPSRPTPTALARTGPPFPVRRGALTGAALVAAGVVLLGLGRRRRPATSTRRSSC